MIIRPVKLLHGNLQLPGDKSISHRAAMLAALAEGTTEIVNFASSADCAATLDCLQNLGVQIERDQINVKIIGKGKNGLRQPAAALNCENSGTTVRLLSGILAGQNFTSVLIGDESLSKRPMRRVIEPLAQMGAAIESNDDRLPLKISGRNQLRAISYELPVASAQVKSCLLLGGLNAAGVTKVYSPKSKIQASSMRDHTERMLRWFGVEVNEQFVETDDNFFVGETTINGNAKLVANGALNVPSDISSAAFFLVAAACLPNSELKLTNVGLNPTRIAIIKVLRRCNVEIAIENQREVCNETIGDLIVTGGSKLAPQFSNANVLRGEEIASLIDELPILAVFGTQLEGGLEIRDAGELRVKESDRISAVVENLRRMNAEVTEFADGLRVEKCELKAAKIESFDDHRIAMAFSVAGLFAKGKTEIAGAECVKVSFPEFFEALENVSR